MDEGFSITFLNNGEAEIVWKLSTQKIELISLYFNKPSHNFVKALRIYRVGNDEFPSRYGSFHEEELLREETSYHYNKFIVGQSYVFEIGIKLDDKKFLPLLRSNLFRIFPEHEISPVRKTREYFKENFTSPAWSERVSTYSLYENHISGWKQ